MIPIAKLAVVFVASAVATASMADYPASIQKTHAPNTVTAPAYPLQISKNNRYLVDSKGVPFLMVGDAPQTLIANLSLAEAAGYIENRRSYGINTLWINILCNWQKICRDDARTFDGVAPFEVDGDLATPNPLYFKRVDDVVQLAATNGMIVLLDPIETSGWLGVLQTNGVPKAFAYGQYLGRRYKEFPNIIWMHGNDFQSWRNRADTELVQAVARGIRSADPAHLQTVELDFLTSGSLDDASWAPLIDLDAAYTYFPTYAQVLTEYNRPQFKPVFLVEAAYEFEHLPRTDGGSTQNLRRQEYWTMLSGATGQLYGSAATWRLEAGWQARLDSPGVLQLLFMRDLLVSRRWYDLVPDQTHSILSSGYGATSYDIGNFAARMGHSRNAIIRGFDFLKRNTGFGSVTTNGYAPAAATPDGALAIVYTPSVRTLVVDIARLQGPVRARWYDPTNGSYLEVAGSPFANTGSRDFRPAGNNAAGDGDWVLLLERQPNR
jgi:hypothetical protein